MSDDLGLIDILIIAFLFGGGFFLTWIFVGAMKERGKPGRGRSTGGATIRTTRPVLAA